MACQRERGRGDGVRLLAPTRLQRRRLHDHTKVHTSREGAVRTALTETRRAGPAQEAERPQEDGQENWTLYLKPTRSWGSWDKRNPFEIKDDQNQTFPVVALTRATIKTSILLNGIY